MDAHQRHIKEIRVYCRPSQWRRGIAGPEGTTEEEEDEEETRKSNGQGRGGGERRENKTVK